jgi:hypothetical protein
MLGRHTLLSWSAVFALALCALAHAARDDGKRIFSLGADSAEKSLKAFSEQSGSGVIFLAEVVKGVRTNRVAGEFTPREALEALLLGTGLMSTRDEATGAFAVRRANPIEPKNGSRAALNPNSDRPDAHTRFRPTSLLQPT